MQTSPYQTSPHEPTKKQLWLAAFTSLLCRLAPEDAIKEADRALELCDERWRDPKWVETWQYAHNYPLGFVFSKSPGENTPGPT